MRRIPAIWVNAARGTPGVMAADAARPVRCASGASKRGGRHLLRLDAAARHWLAFQTFVLTGFPFMTLRAVKPQHETRTRILNAAEELFMQHGFEGASMRMLTAKAGVNLAAVNYHFGSKHA